MKTDRAVDFTLVDADQNVAIWTKGDSGDVFTVLERKSKGLVAMKRVRELIANAAMGHTDLTKSNTDTRLPTGLRTEFPSGVKVMFPC
jgi:hypothetical protein